MEQPLIPFGCCNLSAVNVSKFVVNNEFDWDAFYGTVYYIMGLMDNVIDVMQFPEECSKPPVAKDRFRETTEKYRPVGIGPMGIADAMFMLDIKYDSMEGRKFAGKIMRTMTLAAVRKSAELAAEHGPFFDYEKHKLDVERIIRQHIGVDDKDADDLIKSTWELVKKYGVRNCQFTTAQPTGCLAGDTLISGDGFGVSEIGNMFSSWSSGDIKEINSKTKSDNGEYTYKNWFDKGLQPTRKIITSKGYEIQGTLDHKVRVIDRNGYEWKRISDIENGDYVVMRKDFISDGPEVSVAGGSEPLIFPHEIAEFLGYYMVDGWLYEDNRGNYRTYLSVNKKDEKYVDKLLNGLRKWFKFNVAKREHGENCFKYDIPSNDIGINIFRRFDSIKHGSNNAFIPKFIMNNRDNLFKFIRGYFKGDGCVTTRDGEVVFTTTSEKMAKQLHSILLGLGFPSKIKHYKKSNEKIMICGREVSQNYDVYKIVINNFYSILLGKKIGIEIKDLNRRNIHEKVLLTKEVLPYVDKKNIRESEKGFLWVSNDKCNFSNWFTDNNLMIEKVMSNIDTGLAPVYDMEIEEEGHTYIANGFVTHNTTALSCDCNYGIEPSFGLVFHKNYIDGTQGVIINKIFKDRFKDEPWFSENLMDKIANNGGSLKGIRGIPEEVRKVFVVAHDLKYKDRVDMQAELQKYCSTAISSTVNLPKEVTKEEIAELYMYAWEKCLKGITVYRDGSKENQPITFDQECASEFAEFRRPSRLHSETFKLETGNGSMYVTVSDYKGKPLEVFLYLGKSGQVVNTFSEAIGRLISIALQSGVPVEEVTKTLMGINSDKPTWYRFEESDARPTQILSIPDAIAQLLNRYYAGQRYEGEIDEIGEVCPKCSKPTYVRRFGCWLCAPEIGGCGYSKCS